MPDPSLSELVRRYRDHASVETCCRDRSRLCDECRADAFAQLRGVAACRGEYWARRVSTNRHYRNKAWPTTPRARAIALRLVGDLACDRELLEMYAAEAERWAARWWDAPT